MCVINRDGKVVLIDQTEYIKRLEAAYLDAQIKINAGCDYDGEQVEPDEHDYKRACESLEALKAVKP